MELHILVWVNDLAADGLIIFLLKARRCTGRLHDLPNRNTSAQLVQDRVAWHYGHDLGLVVWEVSLGDGDAK